MRDVASKWYDVMCQVTEEEVSHCADAVELKVKQ